jgi:hypothetical protein
VVNSQDNGLNQWNKPPGTQRRIFVFLNYQKIVEGIPIRILFLQTALLKGINFFHLYLFRTVCYGNFAATKIKRVCILTVHSTRKLLPVHFHKSIDLLYLKNSTNGENLQKQGNFDYCNCEQIGKLTPFVGS